MKKRNLLENIQRMREIVGLNEGLRNDISTSGDYPYNRERRDDMERTNKSSKNKLIAAVKSAFNNREVNIVHFGKPMTVKFIDIRPLSNYGNIFQLTFTGPAFFNIVNIELGLKDDGSADINFESANTTINEESRAFFNEVAAFIHNAESTSNPMEEMKGVGKNVEGTTGNEKA